MTRMDEGYLFLYRRLQWMEEVDCRQQRGIDVMKDRCLIRYPDCNRCESPTIAHFVAMRPIDIYLREFGKLRNRLSLKAQVLTGHKRG